MRNKHHELRSAPNAKSRLKGAFGIVNQQSDAPRIPS
jgi:hypothetical protein